VRHDGQVNPTAPQWQVVVLTGGGSRRMGRDKATLDVGGASLLDRTLAGVPADVPVVVAGPAVSMDRPGVRFVQEDPLGGGPVAGLEAALALTSTPVVVLLATDLPLIGTLPELLAAELAGDDSADPPLDGVLVEDASGRPQQLCAAYRTSALRRAIAETGPANGAAMRDVVSKLRTSTMSVLAVGGTTEVDPTWDIDTPDDVQRLTELLAEPDHDPEGERDG
jgi:molybdopterin-guanine dinucleotide biosynthesis protein A